jgi:hypothetical protein
MRLLTIVVTVLGLSLFETVSSADNAIINAEALSGMSARARRPGKRRGYAKARGPCRADGRHGQRKGVGYTGSREASNSSFRTR